MTSNRPVRETPWKIGSFTKNFSWGPVEKGFARLHHALNVGFEGALEPTPREIFWSRLEKKGFLPHIPANFFAFNGILNNESYIFPDELAFKALKFEHDRAFDKLCFFNLILSEVGKWKGAQKGQTQPSEWARYFVTEQLRDIQDWKPLHYSADAIEKFLISTPRFEGGSGTRKLATNLSYIFSLSQLNNFHSEDNLNWITEAIFLSLDRYTMIERPEKVDIPWAINILAERGIADLTGPFEQEFVETRDLTARLYIESKGTDRLITNDATTIIGVLSREPLIYKMLPSIVGEWLKSRLFVEMIEPGKLEALREFSSEEFYNAAINRLHNKLPKPSLSGNQLLALVRPDDDNN